MPFKSQRPKQFVYKDGKDFQPYLFYSQLPIEPPEKDASLVKILEVRTDKVSRLVAALNLELRFSNETGLTLFLSEAQNQRALLDSIRKELTDNDFTTNVSILPFSQYVSKESFGNPGQIFEELISGNPVNFNIKQDQLTEFICFKISVQKKANCERNTSV
ncbi:MAG: hypothetical protein R3C03_23410 [Pirellulaceae bacterium]